MMDEYAFSECENLCRKVFGQDYTAINILKASGSARKYFRVEIDLKNYVICISENIQENKTFLRLSEYLLNKGINVPRILGVSDDYRSYLLQDLGNRDFMTVLKTNQDSSSTWKDIDEIFSQLVKFQFLPEDEWERLVEFPPLDGELIKYDFRYCETNFINVKTPGYDKEGIWKEFSRLENRLLSYPRELWGLMYRDFQSRNIMMAPGPYFIDYQSSRRGPGLYDVVSFAWQARAGFSPEERNRIIDIYIGKCNERGVECASSVRENVTYWALFRIIQTLGSYGLRGLKEGKPHFIESIPPALSNALALMEDYGIRDEFPVLHFVLEKLLCP